MTTEDRGFRKTREGIVISDKMDKTITVEVSSRVAHGLYSKVMSRSHKLKAHDETNSAGTGDRVSHGLYSKVMSKSHKLKAHDETNSAGIGDRVLVMETRPLSSTKRWRLIEIIEKAK